MPKPMPTGVVQYDPDWAKAFNAEAQLIKTALGYLVDSIHHIGSTAIPGIYAKPIIDMLMFVDRIGRLDEHASSVTALGYDALGEFGLEGRRYFRKDDAAGVRTHQLHCYQRDHSEAHRHLALRDYMIAHPDEAARYGELKRELARSHSNDYDAYMDGKDNYMKRQEAKAMAWWAKRNR